MKNKNLEDLEQELVKLKQTILSTKKRWMVDSLAYTHSLLDEKIKGYKLALQNHKINEDSQTD